MTFIYHGCTVPYVDGLQTLPLFTGMVQHRPAPTVSLRLPRGGNLCDFCGKEPVSKLYACRVFDWNGSPVFRDATGGRWAACWTCAQLIDLDKWNLLTNRVMRMVSQRKGISRAELTSLRGELRRMHKTLAAHLIEGEVLMIISPKFIRFVEC